MFFFFFNDTATTEIYTLSLHDALPIYHHDRDMLGHADRGEDRIDREDDVQHQDLDDRGAESDRALRRVDRKSTRLNSSHANISYAVFCLKKKKKYTYIMTYKARNISL